MVGAIGLVLAIGVFVLLQRYFETVERERFERDATYWSTAFTGSVERHVNSLITSWTNLEEHRVWQSRYTAAGAVASLLGEWAA